MISICVVNKNSEKTIEQSLRSVLGQLDDNFEVVVIDESSDMSVEILEQLKKEYPSILKPFYYGKNPLGGVGSARNESIRRASGQYCIIHIDCDDVWEPHIKDFVSVFLEIEKNYNKPFLLAGHQLNMARKDFLLSIGPYQNVKHGEDRDLWMRLAKTNQYMPIDHVVFFERMKLDNIVHKTKAIKRTYWSIGDEIRGGKNFWKTFLEMFQTHPHLSLTMRISRVLFYLPAYFQNRTNSKIDQSLYFTSSIDWNNYKIAKFGTFIEISKIWGFSSTLDFLHDPVAKEIFLNKRSNLSYQEILHKINLDNKRNKL
jgi:glycosyltransferase involved in cell wall biosynthesis